MTNDQHRRFRDLLDEGYSSRDAADELGLTDAQREEALAFDTDSDDPDLPDYLTDSDLDADEADEPDETDAADQPWFDPTPITHDGGCFTGRGDNPVDTLETVIRHLRTVAAMQDEQTKGLFAGPSVVVDLGPKTRRRFESYRVSEFLTEAPATGDAAIDLDDDDEDDN